MHDRQLEEPEDLVLWEGRCGVCGNWFATKQRHPAAVNPYPHGAFCPVCQDRGLMAPGVLHFKPAVTDYLYRHLRRRFAET
jgi:hypothetical protein